MVAQFLAHKPDNFASLTDSFILSFLKLLKFWPWMQIRQAKNCFPSPKTYRDFRETGPRGQFLESPGKPSPFILKIEVSNVLHLAWQNYQLVKQNAVVC